MSQLPERPDGCAAAGWLSDGGADDRTAEDIGEDLRPAVRALQGATGYVDDVGFADHGDEQVVDGGQAVGHGFDAGQ